MKSEGLLSLSSPGGPSAREGTRRRRSTCQGSFSVAHNLGSPRDKCAEQ